MSVQDETVEKQLSIRGKDTQICATNHIDPKNKKKKKWSKRSVRASQQINAKKEFVVGSIDYTLNRHNKSIEAYETTSPKIISKKLKMAADLEALLPNKLSLIDRNIERNKNEKLSLSKISRRVSQNNRVVEPNFLKQMRVNKHSS